MTKHVRKTPLDVMSWLVLASVLLLSGCGNVLCQAQTDKEVDPLKQYEAQKRCEQLVDEHMDNSYHDERDENMQLLKQSIANNTHTD
ncbi:hypothetical protein H5202_19900 [Shewanella sp. SG41-4]|uniref:hypothetical protein n=1 Tax=Shewanella sp. SG41-4 TaxID=2760976 RepID=UPI0016028B10|nr:hypothetical protein [Shewanella sp. SG41-4]MBB1440878.1 hypothetical protein [Shewanella sp. SG41-4]